MSFFLKAERYPIDTYNSHPDRCESLYKATTWMHLEDITLSEISQPQKNKYCMIPFIRGI
ncbi:hypothetical protein VULLAG_LOCUS12238 [Vulpes lagopus]